MSAVITKSQHVSTLAAVRTILWQWLAPLRSVHLAIILLSLLALGTLVGVLIPQEGLVEIAQIKQQYGTNYRWMKAMGLFNVYSTYWFVCIQVLFFFNLLVGSFQWLRPAYLAATRQTFCDASVIQASSNSFSLTSNLEIPASINEVADLLRQKRYTVYQKADTNQLYATKGNWSRFGPYVAHLGVLLLLIAAVYGTFTGFKAQKLAVPGDTFNLMQSDVFLPNIHLNFWQGSVPDWTVTVKDFRIEMYPDRPVIKQYYADLQVKNAQGQEIKSDTISVNHPLAVDDVTIYQASYQPTGKLFLMINGQPKTLTVNTTFQDRGVSLFPLSGDKALVVFPFFVNQDQIPTNKIVAFIKTPNGFLGQEPGKMPENLRLEQGETGTLDGMTIQFVRPEIATGLQIKKAPEVSLMYLAYLIVMIGAVMCIFSQRQIWTAVTQGPDGQGERIDFLFKTNRAKLSFLKELEQIEARLEQRLNHKTVSKETAS